MAPLDPPPTINMVLLECTIVSLAVCIYRGKEKGRREEGREGKRRGKKKGNQYWLKKIQKGRERGRGGCTLVRRDPPFFQDITLLLYSNAYPK